MPEGKRYISADELKNHNKPGDLWISIQGKIYNVSEWAKDHPGGDLPLRNLAGQDVTDAFVAYHPGSAWQYLDKFFAGYYLKDYQVSETSQDYRKLVSEFSKLGLFEKKGHVIFSLFSIMVMLFVVSIYGVLWSESSWVHLGCGGLMGILWIQSGWIGHDSGHYQIMKSRGLTRFAQILAGNCLTGISIAWWKRNHNAHHIACNSLEFDPDLQHMPIFAVSSSLFDSLTSYFYERKMKFDSFTRFLVSYQHWTFYPVMCVARLNLFGQSIVLLLSKKRVLNRGQEILGILIFWIWYPLLVSCLPNWGERVMFVGTSFAVTGIQHVQFCLNHFSSDVYVGLPSGNDWFENQTNGTLDISCSSWMDWFHGGLQYQIEHHLFPRLPRCHLRKISPLVKDLCKKHNLPYTMVSFWEANVLTIRTLKTAALQARDLTNPIPKNLVWEAVNTHDGCFEIEIAHYRNICRRMVLFFLLLFGFKPAAKGLVEGSVSTLPKIGLSSNQFKFRYLTSVHDFYFSLNHGYRNSLVSKDAILELDTTGNLVLIDRKTTVWMSNTSGTGVNSAVMLDSGNLVLYNTTLYVVWQSFSQPSDTLLPGQPLTVSSELTSTKSPSYGGYYTLKMLQQPTSLSLALTYNSPESYNPLPKYSNYSYWSIPEISNVTGDVVALLDESGSFGIVYGALSDGIVYVYKNDGDNSGLSGNQSLQLSVLRRLTLETNGNIRLYRWDNDVNGSRQWVPEWAAVSNPCDIAGVCGNGICNLNGSNTNASCTCLPGTSPVGPNTWCTANTSSIGNCDSSNGNLTSQFKIKTVQKTNYYFSELSVAANYSDISAVSKCGDACLSDCECVASVYGLDEETAYCWILKSLEFGGYEDPGSTLFFKVGSNGSITPGDNTRRSGGSSERSGSSRNKVLVLPIVLCMSLLVGLLCSLLYYSIYRRRSLKKSLESSLMVSGAPININYRDLQSATCNFSQQLGTGGFGTVYKGSLGDGTLVAVKKLERVLPHGEKEFITEVNTIGSMHHMNLVRLCGFCSEGSNRNRPITVKADVYSYGMLLLEIIGGRRNLDMSFDAENFFYPGWAYKEMTKGTPVRVADKRLEGAVEEEELVKAMKVAFWCIQDEIWMRPSMGEVVKMLEGSVLINEPPMPQTVLELIEEGLDHVYKAMKRDFNHHSSFTINTDPSSRATCSYSTMSPR
ncbi:hypothetical protein HHK36_027617 [Tetracentron sinense]|uniref:non-specific serine/threonine protein kinase n=1 Tax=Tetracentron sinense TaxID=13715 RepID=A0A834YH00_TETSI|nr:hypothetical protein HHK36_027617 [Tetracentron sinense]